MCDHILCWPHVPQVKPLRALFWDGSIEEEKDARIGIHRPCVTGFLSRQRLLPQNREDTRIGIVREPVFTFRR